MILATVMAGLAGACRDDSPTVAGPSTEPGPASVTVASYTIRDLAPWAAKSPQGTS